MRLRVLLVCFNVIRIALAGGGCCEDLGWHKGTYASPVYGVGETGHTMSFGDNFVCANTKILGRCSGKKSFFEAAAFCESGGGRLCTADEVLNDDAHGSG